MALESCGRNDITEKSRQKNLIEKVEYEDIASGVNRKKFKNTIVRCPLKLLLYRLLRFSSMTTQSTVLLCFCF